MMKKKSGLLIGLICCAVIGAAYMFGAFELAEYQGLDRLFKMIDQFKRGCVQFLDFKRVIDMVKYL